MSDSTKKRLAIDLDEIERQLRQTAPAGAGGMRPGNPGSAHDTSPHPASSHGSPRQEGPKQDPLAELARIVGQDDPYRSILSADRAGVQPARRDPDLDGIFAYGRDEHGRETGFEAGHPSDRDSAQPPAASDLDAPTDPELLPDWRNQWREEENFAPELSGQQRADGTLPAGAQDHAGLSVPADRQTPPIRDNDALFAEPGHPAPAPASLQPQQAPPVPPADPVQTRQAPHFGHPGETGAARDDGGFAAALHPRDVYHDQYQHDAYPQAPHHAGHYHADTYGAGAYGRDDYDDGPIHDDYADHHDDIAPRHRGRRSRKAALTVGAVLGMAVIGVASAIIFVGGSGTLPDGEPPLIAADNAPIRVEPTNPGGMDIPDQDRQIFERAAEGETRVVDREEQPVDLEEVARQTPRVVLPPPATAQNRAGPDPIAQVIAGDFDASTNAFESVDPSPAIAELGEPRRVSTVVVRPDGSIIDRNGESRSARPAQPTTQRDTAPMVASAPWSVDPSGRPASAGASSETLPAQNEPAQPAAGEPQATASTERADTAAPEPQAAQPPPAPAQPPAPLALTGAMQIAPQAQQQNSAPQQMASAPATQSAPAPAASGDYVVQLGISNSEARAEQAFGQFRQRYGNIISDSAPIIRRAEVNGSTIYRVRVGPYSLSDANSVCDRIKNSGGDCFVARN